LAVLLLLFVGALHDSCYKVSKDRLVGGLQDADPLRFNKLLKHIKKYSGIQLNDIRS